MRALNFPHNGNPPTATLVALYAGGIYTSAR